MVNFFMAQDYSQVNFRIPTKLKEKIEEASVANNRSITSELVSRLENSFEPEVAPTKTFEFERMQKIQQQQMQEIKALREMFEAFVKKPT